MPEDQCLATVFIAPSDEPKVLDAVGARLRDLAGTDGVPTPPPRLEFVDAESDLGLPDQWAAEHPDEPAGDRRPRSLIAQVPAEDENTAIAVAEVIIDVISPHARAEEEALQAGQPVQATPDQIPWAAHVPLWQNN
ncbi:MAG TPA: hypothetical protein H9870_04805 [Candidatus Corynebacterium avicola]|uniref:Uncharacterized protein n=1 Tax=Candidatus Corynebacterium avicola TaxID=2838527 RepID=A0A9D1RMC5_9CORY|nr:hypothetical protein [Candidatus Corynebacterium avicola]